MMFKNEGETFLPLEISTSLKFLLPNGVEGILLNERLTGNTDHKLVSFVFSNVAYTMILHVRLSLRSFCSCTVRSATTTTPSGPSPDPTDSTRLSLSSSASYSLLLHLIYQSLSWSATLFVVTFIPLFLSLAPPSTLSYHAFISYCSVPGSIICICLSLLYQTYPTPFPPLFAPSFTLYVASSELNCADWYILIADTVSSFLAAFLRLCCEWDSLTWESRIAWFLIISLVVFLLF